ncbi:hypothetical protein GOODEAATRI_012767 [Goodea atripinnis]|uniref:Uncharacterized protein n=1 Tax=Goodea atripinnis TaxID=208336 RepID=A0ABV0P522_9TELE
MVTGAGLVRKVRAEVPGLEQGGVLHMLSMKMHEVLLFCEELPTRLFVCRDGSSSEDSSDTDERVLGNTPNSSVTSLYRKGPPAASSPASRTNPSPNEQTVVSSGGWFIDKGRNPTTKPVFIDLCKEESADREATVLSAGDFIGQNPSAVLQACSEQTDDDTLKLQSAADTVHPLPVHAVYAKFNFRTFCCVHLQRQRAVSQLEPEMCQKKSKKRAKSSVESAESRTMNKKGTT